MEIFEQKIIKIKLEITYQIIGIKVDNFCFTMIRNFKRKLYHL